MRESTAEAARWPWCAALLGAGLMLFHLVASRQYGFHGDELYFIVCGWRPAWGYVDHPPLVPMLARVMTDVFGVHLWALRAPLAIAMGLSCMLTGWLALRLGGGRFAEALAALGFVFAPLLMRFGAFLNIPCFELLLWLLVAHVLVTLCTRDDARWWVLVGALAGLMLLNKHTTLFLGAGLAMGMLLTPRRKDLLTPWPWVGGALAMLIFLPNLLWQYQNGWATLEFVRTLNAAVMQTTSRVEFVVAQVILMNLFNAVLLGGGLYFYLRSPNGARYRLFGWVFLTVMGIMLTLQAKVYYLAPAYPLLLAGGATWLAGHTAGRWGMAVRGVLCAGLVGMGALFAPILTPLGSLAWKDAYTLKVLGFMLQDPTDLSFDFHYQQGRPEQLAAFARAQATLSDADRAECAILAHEYDVASNVNVLGPALGLPPGIGGNNNYFLWGPGKASGNCLLVLGYPESLLRECFSELSIVGESPGILQRAGEPARPIYRCAKPREPLAALWPKFKRYR